MSDLFLNNFTKRYSITKTLAFEAKPVGKTLEHLEMGGIIAADEKLSSDAKRVKTIITDYNKAFINCTLKGISSLDISAFYAEHIKPNSEKDWKEYYAAAKELRTAISNVFAEQMLEYEGKDGIVETNALKAMMGKEFITTILPAYVKSEEDRMLLGQFSKFTTYFGDFIKLRSAAYSPENKANSVASRIVDVNLPKFIKNMDTFKALSESPLSSIISEVQKLAPEGKDISKYFTCEGFADCLAQSEIDAYNHLISGHGDGEKHIKGLNNYINEYNQTVKDRKDALPLFTKLYKMLLSDIGTFSRIPAAFSSDEEMLSAIKDNYPSIHADIDQAEELLKHLEDYDAAGLFIKFDTIKQMSQRIYGDWSVLKNNLCIKYDEERPNEKKSTKTYQEKKDRFFRNAKYISLAEIMDAIEAADDKVSPEAVYSYFAGLGNGGMPVSRVAKELYDEIVAFKSDSSRPIARDNRKKKIIKQYLDTINDFGRFFKAFSGGENENDSDALFYEQHMALTDSFAEFNKIYNSTRNWVTKKPFSTEKIKLNFNNAVLLDGWSEGVIKDKGGILMRRAGKYYLGILPKGIAHYHALMAVEPSETGENFERVSMKLIPDPSKDLPRLTMKDEFGLTPEIKDIYDKRAFRERSPQYSREALDKMISYYTSAVEQYYADREWNLKAAAEYANIEEFFNDVKKQGRVFELVKMDAEKVEGLVESEDLYLFELYCKDFSAHSRGRKNLYTLYWEALFDENNSDYTYRLCGGAELFFRKASYMNPVVHPANEPINNKNINNPKRTSTYPYDIIKNKHYTLDKFIFNVPLQINADAGKENNVTIDARRAINAADDINVIGINRGELNLLYYTVVNSKGEIVEHASLNSIMPEGGSEHAIPTDYRAKLDAIEKNRQQQRKDWEEVDAIANIKKGYLSQVVPKICKLMIKYNAVVVMEDLSGDFKTKRAAIEKNVYQQFEGALIKKLNLYVDKCAKPTEPTGVFKGLQLTDPFTSFEKIGKQNGFLFYVNPAYTTALDPVTGFVNRFLVKYKNKAQAQAFFGSFKSIYYDAAKDLFAFEFDYKDFVDKSKLEGMKTSWTAYSYADRIDVKRNERGKWEYETVNITRLMKSVLNEYGVSYKSGEDLVMAISTHESAAFLNAFMSAFKLMMKMVNKDSEDDFIVSPVMGPDGTFFDSRMASPHMPQNATANGAYNIARKGQLLIRRIQEHEPELLAANKKSEKIDLFISNAQWFESCSDNV